VLTDFHYVFDDNGNITSKEFQHRNPTTPPTNAYTYDGLDRVDTANYHSSIFLLLDTASYGQLE
jgi:hypothetical protein